MWKRDGWDAKPDGDFMPTHELIKLDELFSQDGHKFGMITFKRPQAMNALNAQVLNELEQALDSVAHAGDFRCLILTGEGKAFVAGADITEFQNISPDEAEALSKRGQDLLFKLERLEMPTLAAVNGFALGGGLELALACDFILASEKAKWGLPEVTLGLLPGYGGTQRLVRKTNPGVAKRVALSGEMFSAEDGLRWGLFAQVFGTENFMAEVLKVAETLCQRAPIAVRMTKACVTAALEMDIERGFQVESRAFSEVFKTQDKEEGVKAFLEKRKAHFQGN
jgi:enoyl-CoA hydratase